jgi:hypothetical protein
MGPVATGLGEVYHYLLTSDVYDLTELRTLQDWVIRPRLRRVPGVVEINSWGGKEKQFEARVDPVKLTKCKLTLDDVAGALRENNEDTGGGTIDTAGEASLVHGVGRARVLEDIAGVTILAHEGVPIRVKDVADVATGHVIRRGVDAGGPGAGQRDPRLDGARDVEARGDRAGAHGPPATGPDDRLRGRPGVHPDDALHGHRGGSTKAAGDRGGVRDGL